ncbi:MAG: ribonuclease III [Bacteroidota bacterium]
MYYAAKRFLNTFTKKSARDKRLITAIETIVGSKPNNLSIYRLATKHSSIAHTNSRGIRESNERLEYLGDAILGAAVADFLFRKFPYKEEGFLTEIRSRIVNRESLNNLGRKLGLEAIVEYDQSNKGKLSHKSLYGDTLEAFVGAVYLDKGYLFCKRFIWKKLIIPFFNLEEIVQSNHNYKSMVIEWGQKENKEIKFDIVDVKNQKQFKEFTAMVYIDGEPFGSGQGFNKKKAEQDAAHKTCEMLDLIQE